MKKVMALTIFCMIMCSFVANVFAQTTTTLAPTTTTTTIDPTTTTTIDPTTTTIAPTTTTIAQTTTTTISEPTTTTTISTTTTTIPEVCELTVLAVDVDFKKDADDDKAKFKGTFTGVVFNNDVDVTVTIGTSIISITSGAFIPNDEGNGWKFEDDIDGANVKMKIEGNTEDDSFKFEYEAKNIDLSGTANPLSVMIAFGDSSCDAEVRLNGKLKFKSGKDNDDDGDDDIAINCEEDGNIIIDGCDTGVSTAIGEGNLCEEIRECANGTKNHGQFVRCVSKLVNDLRKDGTISNRERQSLRRCAARSDIGKKKKD
ncbi:MAG: hypothetical protein ACUZ8O_16775, partial [Candidatus Anammoxibacter sp.]